MRFLAVVLALIWLVVPAQAGEFRFITDPDAPFDETSDGPCKARVSGVISEIDKSLFSISPFGENRTLCLNSPGGSLTKALEFPSNRQWVARVLPGERCESACALAFLRAVGIQSDRFSFHRFDRAIWAGGLLGFHAPFLDLPDGVQVDRNTVELAFKVALNTTVTLHRMQELRDVVGNTLLSPFLYQKILETPPDEMYYIDAVGDALMSGIKILGVDARQRIDSALVDRVCQNAHLVSGRYRKSADQQIVNAPPGLHSLVNAYYYKLRSKPLEDGVVLFDPVDGTTIGVHTGFYPSVDDDELYSKCWVRFYTKKQAGQLVYDGGYVDVYLLDHTLDGVMRAEPLDVANARNSWEFVVQNHSPIVLPAIASFDFDARLEHLPKDALFNRYFPKFTPQGPVRKLIKLQYPGHDLAGGDLIKFSSPSLTHCKEACEELDICPALTYDRWNKKCFLKAPGSALILRRSAKATSYIRSDIAQDVRHSSGDVVQRKRTNKAFRGTSEEILDVPDFELCMKTCSWSDCMGVNYRDGQCELFEAPPEYFTETGVTVGWFEQK